MKTFTMDDQRVRRVVARVYLKSLTGEGLDKLTITGDHFQVVTQISAMAAGWHRLSHAVMVDPGYDDTYHNLRWTRDNNGDSQFTQSWRGR